MIHEKVYSYESLQNFNYIPYICLSVGNGNNDFNIITDSQIYISETSPPPGIYIDLTNTEATVTRAMFEQTRLLNTTTNTKVNQGDQTL